MTAAAFSHLPNPADGAGLLHRLLEAGLSLGPEYGSGLSSHLPMALHALHALGAPPARLQAFSDGYASRFARQGAAAASHPLAADWRAARGDFAAFEPLRHRFEALLQEQGCDATLSAVLPDLWPGAAGSAFHGLIRTAHAVQAGHAGELAVALAYWAARWQAVPAAAADEKGPARPPLPWADWATQVEAAAGALRLPGTLISRRIEAAVLTPAYAAWAGASVLPADLQPLSDWAADLYARSGNFTVLHVATATRAARVLSPWTTAAAEVREGLLRAATAAVLSSNLRLAAPMPDEESLPPWPVLIDGAIASNDDHVIKLVHAMVEERAVYGEGARQIRQRAALRALRL